MTTLAVVGALYFVDMLMCGSEQSFTNQTTPSRRNPNSKVSYFHCAYLYFTHSSYSCVEIVHFYSHIMTAFRTREEGL